MCETPQAFRVLFETVTHKNIGVLNHTATEVDNRKVKHFIIYSYDSWVHRYTSEDG
jgi:hypothetical protein